MMPGSAHAIHYRRPDNLPPFAFRWAAGADAGGEKIEKIEIFLRRGLTKQHCAAIIIQGIIQKTV